MSITENVAAVRAKIAEAAIAVGRRPEDILLCAATKMNDAAAVREAIAAGVDLCGENREQELTRKLSENAYAGVPVHFIGHLQTNKVRRVVGKVAVIQSVDSLRLLEAIQRQAAALSIVQDILLEVNVGEEEQKGGFSPAGICAVLPKTADCPNIRVRGLMAIPPFAKKAAIMTNFLQKCATLLLT